MSEEQKNSLKKLLQKVIAMLLAAVFVVICINAVKSIKPLTEGKPRTLTQLPNPTATVEAFFEAIVENDFETAASYTSNYSSLGISNDTYENSDDVISQKLYSMIASSYSYSLTDECIVESKTAVQQVDFTFFEVEAITAELGEYAKNIAYDKAYSGTAIDENSANEILSEALDSIDDISDYLVTKRFEVTLNYDGEAWYIDLSPELLSAIAGIK